MNHTQKNKSIDRLVAQLDELIRVNKAYAPQDLKKAASMLVKVAELLESQDSVSYDMPDSYGLYAVKYLTSHFSEKISIDELASHIGISRGYLTQLVKDLTGLSPKQYLIRFRMEMAAKYLTEDNLPISQVAASCGYSDPLTFSKAFRKQYGVSPTEYRSGSGLTDFGTSPDTTQTS